MNSQRFSTMSQNWSISPDETIILKDVRTQNCGRNVVQLNAADARADTYDKDRRVARDSQK